MYAIIKTGGKQYRVAVGDTVDVELLDTEEGKQVKFDEVLFAYDGSKAKIGQPGIANFHVYGEVIGTVQGPKVKGLKYKPSHTESRKWGHRQKYSRIKITAIGKPKKDKGE